ncbi:MAG: hypothetical protein JST04_15530 [Bdellovibrionales bacterium]|nr:hypothetical protein [Bdellovibrionales bacterium]
MTIPNLSKRTGLLLTGWGLVAFSAWMNSFPSREGTVFRFALWLVGGAIAILFGSAGDRARRWAAAAAVVGLSAGFYYSVLTPIDVRAHDVAGHLWNVEYLRETGGYPRMDMAWETFQPPLYYLAVLATTATGLVPSDLSYLLFAATLVGFLLWRPNAVALGILGLLPAHLFFAGRMNNDVAFPLYGLGFLFLHDRIAKEESGMRASLAMGLLLAVSVLTKMSGLAFGAALLPLLYHEVRAGREARAGRWARIFAMTVPATAALAFWFGRSYLQTGNPLFTNIAAMPEQLRIPNDLNRFIGFDFRAFFGQVSADPWGGRIREQVWPYFIVTALQGEFPYPATFGKIFTAERIVTLFLLLAGLAALFPRKNRELLRSGAFALLVAQTAFFVVLSAMNPFGPNHDARYWGIAFPAIAWLFGEIVSRTNSPGLRTGMLAGAGALTTLFLGFYFKLLG